jgi:hypothetical protein
LAGTLGGTSESHSFCHHLVNPSYRLVKTSPRRLCCLWRQRWAADKAAGAVKVFDPKLKTTLAAAAAVGQRAPTVCVCRLSDELM